jgi:hypothetical protein
MAVKVKNSVNTSDRKCECPKGEGTWLNHWALRKGTPHYCRNADCANKATLGGHVKKMGVNDSRHYIVPLCDSCNKLSDEFSVTPDDVFVSEDCN